MRFSTKAFDSKATCKAAASSNLEDQGTVLSLTLITGFSGKRNSAGIGGNSTQYSPVGNGGTQAVSPRQGAVPKVTVSRFRQPGSIQPPKQI